MKKCLDCGKEKSDKGNYCKSCGYKHRTRPVGLKYVLHKTNPTWFKKGIRNNLQGEFKKGEHFNQETEFKKGERVSPKTEFKYVNGLGYRNKIGKELPSFCCVCAETNIKRLHVHHIDENRLNNNCENLIVLCRPHHLEKHNRTERVYVEGRKAIG